MAKISENLIPDINADWGLDVSNNLPYSGEAVQEFIKRTLKQKYGYFYYDENNNRYLVFTDEASKDLYLDDPATNSALLLSSFDAPFNYSAKIEMISESLTTFVISFQKTLSILLTQNRCAKRKTFKFSKLATLCAVGL